MLPWMGLGDPFSLAFLAVAAFFAGLMDSIAGGGGIITVPALLATGIPPLSALATNKLQACFGSGTALLRYARAGLVPRDEVGWATGFTAVGAVAGALTVRVLPTNWLGWLVPILLVGIFLFLLFKPEWGKQTRESRWPTQGFYVVFGLVLGFYDGFLGPGTGTFWTVALTSLLGNSLVRATAQTKVVNFTSNLVSLIVFIVLGQVLWLLGLLMGLFQALGARVGSGLALKRGAGFIRGIFLAVVALTLAKLLWTALT